MCDFSMNCRRIEILEERLAAVCKERDNLREEVARLNRENFEQSLMIKENMDDGK